MSSQHVCPFCASPLLCQIKGGTLSWYCRHCHLDIPYGIAHDIDHHNQTIAYTGQDCSQNFLEELLKNNIQEIKEALSADRVMLWKHSKTGELRVLLEALNPKYPTMKDWRVGHFFTSQEVCEFKQGKLQVRDNIQTKHQNNLLESFFKVKARLLAPVIINRESNDAQLWGLLIVHDCTKNRQWQESEIKLVSLIAQQIGTQIEQNEKFQRLKLAYDNLEKIAGWDRATGLSSSCKLEDYLCQQWQKMAQFQQPLSVIICAVEGDGNKFSPQIAQVINQVCHQQEKLIVKNEAEELIIVLPFTDGTKAVKQGEELRKRVQKLDLDPKLKLSLAIASAIPKQDGEPNNLLQSAQEALTRGKTSGGDPLVFQHHYLKPSVDLKANAWEHLSSIEQLKAYIAYFISRGKRVISPGSGPFYFKGLVYQYQGYHQNFLDFWQQLRVRKDFLDLYLQGDRCSFGNFIDESVVVGECARCNVPIPTPVGAAYDIPHCDLCDEYEHQHEVVRVIAIAQPLTQMVQLQQLCARNRIQLTCVSTPESLKSYLGIEPIDLILIHGQIPFKLAQTWAKQIHEVLPLAEVPIIALSKEAGHGITGINSQQELAKYLLSPLNGKHLAEYLRELSEQSLNSQHKRLVNWFPG